MAVIEFGRAKDRNYTTGLDNGVLYVEDGPVVPWNGLQGLDDSGASDVRNFYLDGIKYLSYVTPRDYAAKLSCVTYPDELNPALGLGQLGDGFYADSQVPTRFSFSYRTKSTIPDFDTIPQYKIHLVYKVMASVSGFSHSTLGDSAEPMPFEFELSAVPILVPLMRPTAHFVFDSRKMGSVGMASLQKIIYGSANTEPRLPNIGELIEFLKFTNEVRVVDNGDGTWSAIGNATNVSGNDETGRFDILNVSGTNPDANGKYNLDVTP